MAPPKAGKTKYNLRMKPVDIAAFKDIAVRSGYSSHAALCAKILEDSLAYLLDTERSRMPDVLLELKQKLSVRQLAEVATRIKKTEPDEGDALKKYIESVVEAKLHATGGEKKTALGGGSRSTSPTGKGSATNTNLR